MDLCFHLFSVSQNERFPLFKVVVLFLVPDASVSSILTLVAHHVGFQRTSFLTSTYTRYQPKIAVQRKK